ncbi:MAG TPA: hypothetical protein DEP28_01880, partial [Bacteroidetes bacterium]|nr:hypothetical protein [Bacteroidota bacterium]
KNIFYTSLSYEESKVKLQELESIINNSTDEIKKLYGKNPILLGEIDSVKLLLNFEILKLKKHRDPNKPLPNSEIYKIVFSKKQLSIDFINKYCLIADRKINYIYDLDVFNYYNVQGYHTNLQKEVFKKTEGYKDDLNELKKKKIELNKTVYYYEDKTLFSSAGYNTKKKRFEILVNLNYGLGTEYAKPPKSFFIEHWKYNSKYKIQFSSLPTQKFIEIIPEYYDLGTKEILFIPMNVENGLEMENDKSYISIYFLFTPSTKRKIEYKFYDILKKFPEGVYYMTSDIITAQKVRVIVINKRTGKIYFDKIY